MIGWLSYYQNFLEMVALFGAAILARRKNQKTLSRALVLMALPALFSWLIPVLQNSAENSHHDYINSISFRVFLGWFQIVGCFLLFWAIANMGTTRAAAVETDSGTSEIGQDPAAAKKDPGPGLLQLAGVLSRINVILGLILWGVLVLYSVMVLTTELTSGASIGLGIIYFAILILSAPLGLLCLLGIFLSALAWRKFGLPRGKRYFFTSLSVLLVSLASYAAIWIFLL